MRQSPLLGHSVAVACQVGRIGQIRLHPLGRPHTSGKAGGAASSPPVGASQSSISPRKTHRAGFEHQASIDGIALYTPALLIASAKGRGGLQGHRQGLHGLGQGDRVVHLFFY